MNSIKPYYYLIDREERIKFMFNVSEEHYIKYQLQYPDELLSTSQIYNSFKNMHEEVFFYLNEHLKLFPLLDSWRIEICYIWDVCRMSMICATTLYEEDVRNKFDPENLTDEIVYSYINVEYYLENVIYRGFSLLEKLAHTINLIYDFGLTKREVSFFRIKDEIKIHHSDTEIKSIIEEFEKNDVVLKLIRETRHAFTHRNDPLSPFYEIEELVIELDERNEDIPEKVIAYTPIQHEANLSTDELVTATRSFYIEITKLIEKVLLHDLKVLAKRFEDEQDFYFRSDFILEES